MKKIFALLLSLILWANVAKAVPTIDAHVYSFCNATSPCTASITTTHTNDIIIVLLGEYGANAGAPGAISDTSTLSWTTRANTNISVGGSNHLGMKEAWSLAASTLSGDTISGVCAVTVLGCFVEAYAISGINTTTPFDANVGLPYIGTSTAQSSSISDTVTTSNASDFIILSLSTGGGLAGGGPAGTISEPAGFTKLDGDTSQDFGYNNISSIQSSVVFTDSWTGTGSGGGQYPFLKIFFVDALQSAAPINKGILLNSVF